MITEPELTPPSPEQPPAEEPLLPHSPSEQAEEAVASRVRKLEEIVDQRLKGLEERGIIPADDNGERRQRMMKLLAKRSRR